ncbi:MAG TPA: UbiA-like polyprenyltransferase [Gemmataceae bacterium]|nr:UbiA-like polyprenyltransferase [Gemmataceae bacterium]
MFGRLRLLLGLIRFSHTVFALPFALSSAVLAWREDESINGRQFALDLVGILLCMAFARSAAMAFNRLADRHIDADNPRTATRHLPAGLLTPAAVWAFTLVCAAGFVTSTLLFVLSSDNRWPLYLAGPVLLFLCAYSYTKRFTSLAHFWLGASLLLAPVAAWIAIRGLDGILGTPLVLGLAVLFWVAGFDILYACQDIEFDRKAGLASVPARLGVRHSLRVALACHLVMVALLVVLFWVAEPLSGVVYGAGVAAVAVLVGYEHWLVRPDDLSRVNRAFFTVNGVISIGLFVVVLAQLAVGTRLPR